MPRICVHLQTIHSQDYAHYFDGTGLDYALICKPCCNDPGAIEANLLEVTPEQFAEV